MLPIMLLICDKRSMHARRLVMHCIRGPKEVTNSEYSAVLIIPIKPGREEIPKKKGMCDTFIYSTFLKGFFAFCTLIQEDFLGGYITLQLAPRRSTTKYQCCIPGRESPFTSGANCAWPAAQVALLRTAWRSLCAELGGSCRDIKCVFRGCIY